MKEAFKDVVEALKSNITEQETTAEDDIIEFSDPGYKAVPISRNNFHEITKTESSSRTAFLDGGNAEIISMPNLSLQFVRVYYNVYRENKKTKSNKKEMFVLIRSINKDNKIKFSVDIFPKNNILDEKEIVFDSLDKTITQGQQRAEITRIGDIIRRFAELSVACAAVEQLDKDDALVLDGTLQALVTNENKYLERLYEAAAKKGVFVTALAKTSRLFTKKGSSFPAVISSIAPEYAWCYHPVVGIDNPDHKADMHMIKLNRDSKHVFRFESYNQQELSKNVFSLLKDNAKDPVFVGYPYGLIDADRNARVSNSEKEYLKTKLAALLGKHWQKLQKGMTQLNAHSILDNIG